MKRGYIKSLATLAIVTGLGALLLHGCLALSSERAKVRDRYEQMHTALRTGDTNAARLLFAPACRARAHDHFGRLTTFARPLGLKSGISIDGARAVICPERVIPLIPFFGTVGHTIEMVQVDGEWYFTGKISVF